MRDTVLIVGVFVNRKVESKRRKNERSNGTKLERLWKRKRNRLIIDLPPKAKFEELIFAGGVVGPKVTVEEWHEPEGDMPGAWRYAGGCDIYGKVTKFYVVTVPVGDDWPVYR